MSIFKTLKNILQKTSNKVTSAVSDILHKKLITEADLELLEEALLSVDVGIDYTQKILEQVRRKRFDPKYNESDLKTYLSNIVEDMLSSSEKEVTTTSKPTVILFCGVNGSGKTTSIGKLAYYYKTKGLSVCIAACDTFRAAAIEQLKVWSDRSGSHFISSYESKDPAAIAYQSLEYSIKNNVDVLLIDTAGRLQNYTNLMNELAKISKVLQKLNADAPHYAMLVLDSTIGQNAISQVQEFNKAIPLSGIILNKLDGTAKGGVVIPITQKFNIPIYFIGTGEQIQDIKTFSSKEFANAMFEI